MRQTIERTAAEAYRDTKHYRRTREWQDQLPALPTAEELAEPIVRGLITLANVAQRHDAGSMAFGVEQGEFRDDARELVDTIDRAALLVDLAAESCVPGGASVILGTSARAIIMTIADTAGARYELNRLDYERGAYG